jgi:uncharacterized protein YdeI (YjbR/CyaY-like superfamily)
MGNNELPVLPFASALQWEQWLHQNHDQCDGIWIRIAIKQSSVATVTLNEAIDVALCYGWIDGQRITHNPASFLQKFTPRRPKSLWSKRTIARVALLITAGRMQPPGLLEATMAQEDGRWEIAYASTKHVAFPEDFLQVLEKNKQALAFFNTLNRSEVYAIARQLETARTPQSRQRHFAALLSMLGKGVFR